MKILQINSVCGVGSTGRIAADLHASLTENGVDSRIAYGRGEALRCDAAIRIGTVWDNYRHVAKTRLLDRHGFSSRGATRRFLRGVEEFGPDLIHLHNIHGYYLHIGELFGWLKRAGLPVVWTLHDCWPFTGHCAYYDYAGCSRWESGCRRCPQKRAYPASLLADASSRNYADKRRLFTGVDRLTLVTPSVWLAGEVGRSFLKDYPVRVIPNGIDLTAFRPTEEIGAVRRRFGIREEDCLLLGVAGVWEARKGLPYLLELLNRLGGGYRLMLVGMDEKQRAALPAGAIGIGRTDSVEELAALYSAADMLVNPTLEDNFPTVNLEALACGTPVVTFRTGGSVESVDDATGRVADKGGPESLAAAVRDIKTRGKPAFTAACRERAERLYDQRQTYAQYGCLYRELCGGTPEE